MPVRAKSPCRQAGCRALVDKAGFCYQHRREVYKAQKQVVSVDYKERNRFYQRKEWKSLRALRLQLEPLCRSCRAAGRLVEATVVDHIVAIEDGGARLDLDNTQSTCVSCHSAKTRQEERVRAGAG